MRIVLAQLNPIIGDIKGNLAKIIKAIDEARAIKAEIILFSELVLCGYPAEDLLHIPDFITENEIALEAIVQATKGITVVVGTIRRNRNEHGKRLYNSAAVIFDQKLMGYQDKILLPTYDVFDERRYFEPGKLSKIWQINNKRVGITICEDVWGHTEHESNYLSNPVIELKKQNPDFVFNLSASPYSINQLKNRMTICENAAKTMSAPLFYCNQIGANDSLIFDGYSMVFNEKGDLLDIAKGFEEDFLVVDLSLKPKPKKIEENSFSDLYQALVLGCRDYFHKLKFKKAVLGISGGIDSALVACIAVDALGPDNVLCIAMPSRFSSPESLTDAKKLCQNLGCKFKEISIETPFVAYLNLLEPHFQNKPFDVTEENMQARIRGMILMAFSNKYGSIVLATGNKSELALGYCTLYGDMCGGLAVIGDVTKSQVYALSNWINREKEIIPKNSLTKAPSAELRPNQKDQDTLPDYEIVDNVLNIYLEEHLSPDQIAKKFNYPLNIVKDLIKKIHQNEYKRYQAPPALRVSGRAFTVGRRFPIVQSWG